MTPADSGVDYLMNSLKLLSVAGAFLVEMSLRSIAGIIVIDSPDHPKTWDPADKTQQFLQWDSKRQCLVADVTYSNHLWNRSAADTPEEEDFKINFPGIRFNPETHILSVNGVPIGERHPLLFGYDIALFPNVEVSVREHDGYIYGRILAYHGGK